MTSNDFAALTPAEQEQLSLYVFGLLDRSQAEHIERRVQESELWRLELSALQDALITSAVLQLPPASVPANAEAALMARVRAAATPDQGAALPPLLRVAPRSRWGMPLAWLAAAAATAALFAGPLHNTPQRQLARFEAQAGALSTSLKADSGALLGTAVRLPSGRTFVLLSHEAPAGKIYQAWQVVGLRPQSLGVFEGRSLSVGLVGQAVFAVSVEPPGGSAQPTSTPIMVQRL